MNRYPDHGLDVDDLRPGVVYDVSFDDCCVAGTFVAELLRVERLSVADGTARHEVDDGAAAALVFDGITLTEWAGATFREDGWCRECRAPRGHTSECERGLRDMIANTDD